MQWSIAGVARRYRVRQGQFRIVYAVDDTAPTVEVVKLGHRREVYRGAA
ncbi:MAG TPA: type II toxin-antitoxin system RelE/ParE family toxin [Casimicrobiaceae bacterium]